MHGGYRLPAGPTLPLADDGNVDDTELRRAIITATRLIDGYFDWNGSPATDSQSLDWPRQIDGIDSATVPVEIQLATCAEVAYLTGDSAPAWYSGADAIRQPLQVRAGPVSLSYDAGDSAAVQPVSRAVIDAIPAGMVPLRRYRRSQHRIGSSGMSLARELAAGVQAAALLTDSLSESLTWHRAAGEDVQLSGIVERTGAFTRDLDGAEADGNTRVTVFRRLSPGRKDQLTVRGERVAILDYAIAPIPGETTVTTLRVDLS